VESQSAGTLSLLINGKTVETKFKAPYCFTPGRISASDKIQLEYTNSIGMMLETPKPEFATRENKAGILSVSLARKSFNN
jgi:hypothetical protein